MEVLIELRRAKGEEIVLKDAAKNAIIDALDKENSQVFEFLTRFSKEFPNDTTLIEQTLIEHAIRPESNISTPEIELIGLLSSKLSETAHKKLAESISELCSSKNTNYISKALKLTATLSIAKPFTSELKAYLETREIFLVDDTSEAVREKFKLAHAFVSAGVLSSDNVAQELIGTFGTASGEILSEVLATLLLLAESVEETSKQTIFDFVVSKLDALEQGFKQSTQNTLGNLVNSASEEGQRKYSKILIESLENNASQLDPAIKASWKVMTQEEVEEALLALAKSSIEDDSNSWKERVQSGLSALRDRDDVIPNIFARLVGHQNAESFVSLASRYLSETGLNSNRKEARKSIQQNVESTTPKEDIEPYLLFLSATRRYDVKDTSENLSVIVEMMNHQSLLGLAIKWLPHLVPTEEIKQQHKTTLARALSQAAAENETLRAEIDSLADSYNLKTKALKKYWDKPVAKDLLQNPPTAQSNQSPT